MASGQQTDPKAERGAKTPVILPRHYRIYPFIRAASFLYSRLVLGFRCKDRFRAGPGEAVIVLSNHQTDQDPFCLFPSFLTPTFPVATDNIFCGRLAGKLMDWLGVIPKRKGAADVRSVMAMRRVLREKGSLMLFPEGNRTYAEFQYYIAPGLAKFIRRSGATLVLFQLRGGTGVSPRFKRGFRRGPFTGAIREVLRPEDYAALSDEALFQRIREGLRVYDSESGQRWNSPRRAEYLERMLFVCPKCGGMQTLRSRGTRIRCGACGCAAEFTEDLHLRFEDPAAGFPRLVDWWRFQQRTVRELPLVPGEIIFRDEGLSLRRTQPYENAVVLETNAALRVSDRELVCGGHSFPVTDVEFCSVISGRKLAFTCGGADYVLRGGPRFNPVKYALLFHRLDTKLAREGNDEYFGLEEV